MFHVNLPTSNCRYLLVIDAGTPFDKKLPKYRVVADKQLFAKQRQRLHLRVTNYNWKTHKTIEGLHHQENSL